MKIAFIASNRIKIELDRKQGSFSSKIVGIFIKNPEKYLATMIIGNTIILVLYVFIMADLLEPMIFRYINLSVIMVLIQIIVCALLLLLVGEFIPKIFFRSEPNIVLNVFAVPIMFFYILFYPVTYFITLISEKIIKTIYKDENTQEKIKNMFSKINLMNLVSQLQDSKPDLSEGDNDLKIFQNALDFTSVKVRDCMVPRTEILAVEIDAPLNELPQKFIDSGLSKILVYKDTIDNISGYITSKLLFKKFESIQEKVIDISFVPETMPAHKLLAKFITEKKSIAVVVDEFGGVSGMLTIEDIIEEIFGEIEDEHDTVDLIEKNISDNEYVFSGRLEIDYLNEKYGLKLPESEDYETLAGMITSYYQSIPETQQQITIESFEIKILNVSKTRIELVKLTKEGK